MAEVLVVAAAVSVDEQFQNGQEQRQQEVEMKETAKGRGRRQRLQNIKDEELQAPCAQRVLGSSKALRAEGLTSMPGR